MSRHSYFLSTKRKLKNTKCDDKIYSHCISGLGLEEEIYNVHFPIVMTGFHGPFNALIHIEHRRAKPGKHGENPSDLPLAVTWARLVPHR